MWMKLGYNVHGDTTNRHMENDPLAPPTHYATWRKLGFFLTHACFSTNLDEAFLQCVRRPSIRYMENEGLVLRAHCLTGMYHMKKP